MAWMNTLRGILDPRERDARDLVAGLREVRRGFLERARRLELTADQAPSASAESDLRRLAADHRATADLVADALASYNVSTKDAPVAVPASSAVNHWARIVEDLEVFQAGRNRILDLARDLADLDAVLPDLFDTLTRRMNEHVARLRGEIAQADPQALN